ncbi:acetyl coenzyme A acetyltransferase, mitochondria l [Trichuris trichiura]|uniref:acetyl-CoA C-acetyltransferase n=1 Tax=Trichuris trichiura TaxID=36087 RepID=A0A077Z8S0_TRITR|nr:acetyl coenzyme A acetyltransferase, mitochondria l [Trichuris trichiura]
MIRLLYAGAKRSMSTKAQKVYVVSACRTPMGSFRSSLAPLKAPKLGSIAIAAAVQRSGMSPLAVQEVYMGHVLQAFTGQAPARQAALMAGLDVSTPATTINKVCASGLKAVMLASQSLALNYRQVMVAGGMESMSNAPFYLAREEPSYGGTKLHDGLVHDGLLDAMNEILMGECAEKTAIEHGISRKDQDAYAILSYRRSSDAWKKNIFQEEVVPVEVKHRKGQTIVCVDEEYRKCDFSRFSSLKPAFVKEHGTITAANASTLNDGACAMVLANEKGLEQTVAKPIAEVVSFGDNAVDPMDFSIAPVKAVEYVLEQAGLRKEDVTLWEINEAFSVTALANIKLLGLDPEKVNIHGGAVSLGHPIGMSGARLITHLVHVLNSGEFGLATACNGGGGASAVLVKKL